mmetsp:Transcript_29155/g.69453  ORF Transcript_29155/g.69453 Transcript_29155/m.69453 type:complete len:210 (+) Transcript_29155:8598-9227(+)
MVFSHDQAQADVADAQMQEVWRDDAAQLRVPKQNRLHPSIVIEQALQTAAEVSAQHRDVGHIPEVNKARLKGHDPNAGPGVEDHRLLGEELAIVGEGHREVGSILLPEWHTTHHHLGAHHTNLDAEHQLIAHEASTAWKVFEEAAMESEPLVALCFDLLRAYPEKLRQKSVAEHPGLSVRHLLHRLTAEDVKGHCLVGEGFRDDGLHER